MSSNNLLNPSPSVLPSLIAKLRASLADNEDFQKLKDIVGTDDRLSRFLISRQLDLEKSKDMIEKHLLWRKENDPDKWRQFMLDKPFLTTSFPHEETLRSKGLGMLHVALHAGNSRTGEAIMIEVLGADGQSDEISESQQDIVQNLTEFYIAFFEKRTMILAEMSKEQSRMVCTLQLRDVSKLSFMPRAGAFAIMQRIMSMGMNNYPESASNILFISPPTIFAAVFSIVKRWLPEDVNRKFRFIAKQDVPVELLKYVEPSVVIALRDIHEGKSGDEICNEMNGIKKYELPKGETSVEVTVAARDVHHLFFHLGLKGASKVSWNRLNTDESPKSRVIARLLYAEPSTRNMPAEKVNIVTHELPDTQLYATVPDVPDLDEGALLCLCLDHTSAWIQSHTFKLRVTVE